LDPCFGATDLGFSALKRSTLGLRLRRQGLLTRLLSGYERLFRRGRLGFHSRTLCGNPSLTLNLALFFFGFRLFHLALSLALNCGLFGLGFLLNFFQFLSCSGCIPTHHELESACHNTDYTTQK
jgi:hypothetical protein